MHLQRDYRKQDAVGAVPVTVRTARDIPVK